MYLLCDDFGIYLVYFDILCCNCFYGIISGKNVGIVIVFRKFYFI